MEERGRMHIGGTKKNSFNDDDAVVVVHTQRTTTEYIWNEMQITDLRKYCYGRATAYVANNKRPRETPGRRGTTVADDTRVVRDANKYPPLSLLHFTLTEIEKRECSGIWNKNCRSAEQQCTLLAYLSVFPAPLLLYCRCTLRYGGIYISEINYIYMNLYAERVLTKRIRLKVKEKKNH